MSPDVCEHCGTKLIDECLMCGAPVCCPKCCLEATSIILPSLVCGECMENNEWLDDYDGYDEGPEVEQ